MSTRSEYEAAKRNYHRTGNALRKAHESRSFGGPAAKDLEKDYSKAKAQYHKLGRQVAKKGK